MNNTDGSIVIGTVVDDKEFYKKIKEFDNTKVKDFEINPELDVETLQQEILKAYQELQKFKNLDIISEEDLIKMKTYLSFIEKANDRISELGGQQIIIKGLNDSEASLEQIEESARKIDLSQVETQLKGIGKSVESVTKKISKWALAIFGIRSAVSFIRNSMSTLSQYNEQMGVDVDYIRYLLASTLQPVIENLIQLVYKLLAYVNYIAKAWFGVNLFANASTEAFQKQNKALGSSAKKAKELQKTLSGFDEMNILQDNGDVSSGGGGGGVSLPSFEAMEDVPIPSWLQWIVDNKDLVMAGLAGIATGLTALKLGFKGVQALGIGTIVLGIVNLISDIVDFIQDPSWQNFVAILGDVATVIGGIMLVMGNWWGLLVVIVGLAVKLIAENWDAIKEILGKVGGWIYDHIIKPVGDFFGKLWDGIKTDVATAVQWIKDKFSSIVSFFSTVISKIIGLFQTIGTTVGNVISGAFKGVINGVLSAIENILNFPIRSINKLIGVINKVPGINLGTLSTFSLPRLAKGGIINQPGRGVMLGSAIGGERGQEGVIPLTDTQQMELLGEAIGRYITINANITNNMNGRTISRELQKIQNRDNFLYNR